MTLDEIRRENQRRKEVYADVKHVGDSGKWAWLSYGEKCYAYAVVEACLLDDDENATITGHLKPHPDKERTYVDSLNRDCVILNWICDREEQDGARFCKFVAHARNDNAAEVIDELLARIDQLEKGVGK